MRICHSRQTNQGLTLFEVIVVILILAFLVVMISPLLAPPKRKWHPFVCTNNLKQTALAYKIWAGDHNDKYPMELSVTNGGTMELMNTSDAWKTFQVMSNEISTPLIIHCPQDSIHVYATNFDDTLKSKISYFIAASATTFGDPQLFLSGDDNFLLNQKPIQPGLIGVTSASPLKWDGDRHGSLLRRGWFDASKKFGGGNIGLTDGSVQTTTDFTLSNYLNETSLGTYPGQPLLITNLLAIP